MGEIGRKSSKNRQLQSDAVSSVFNSQSTSCTKVGGIFKLRTNMWDFFPKSKIYSSKKIKNGVFCENFKILGKPPQKILPRPLTKISYDLFAATFNSRSEYAIRSKIGSPMTAQRSRLWLVVEPKRSPCKISYDDVTRPFFPENDRHVRSLEHRGWYPEMRLVETYTPIPHTAHYPFSSDLQKSQKPFSTSHFRPPWPLPLKTKKKFLRNKVRLGISVYEFFVKTGSFPIGEKLSRKFNSFRRFGGCIRKAEVSVVDWRAPCICLLGGRHRRHCGWAVLGAGASRGRPQPFPQPHGARRYR